MRGLAHGPKAGYQLGMASTSLNRRDEQALVKSEEVRRWGMWLHLSVFANLLLPVLGTIAPIAVWLMKKDEAPGLQVHARNNINGMISYAGYGLALTLLSAIPFFGFLFWPAIAVLGILGVASPMLAALKARKGEAMSYPLALPVLDLLGDKDS